MTSDYTAGYATAKDCFNHSLRTGRCCPGSAPYVHFVEAVAWSMRSKEDIPQERIEVLKELLHVEPSNKFNQGAYDFLMEKIRKYQKGFTVPKKQVA